MIKAAKLFLVGWIILLWAIVLNGLAARIGLVGWYDFLDGRAANIASLIFLFLLYPALLGLGAGLAVKALFSLDKGQG